MAPQPVDPGGLRCPGCGRRSKPAEDALVCSACRAPLSYLPPERAPARGQLTGKGVWRYAPLLPDVPPVTLGEGGTPLVESLRVGPRLSLDLAYKVEGCNPSGSFKDRGTTVLVSALAKAGYRVVADDSSGNAGAALATYAARAGLAARLYVPKEASPRKLAQIRALGAELRTIAGPRERCTEAVFEDCAREQDLAYASHTLSPFFLAGLTSLAYELAEEQDWRSPEHLIVPAGGGGLFLGLVYGFLRMAEWGWVSHVPQVHLVQPAACAPLARAFVRGSTHPLPVVPGQTVAEGTRIASPERGTEVLAALRTVGGEARAVEDAQILRALQRLACEEGLWVEPTSGLAVAGLELLATEGVLQSGERVVVVLTGSGLKSP